MSHHRSDPARDHPAEHLVDGRALQTQLYRQALEHLFGKTVVAAGFFNFKAGKFVDLDATLARQLQKLAAAGQAVQTDARLHTEQLTLGLAREAAAGRMAVDPAPGACAHCDYSALCRVDRWSDLLAAGEEESGDDGDA